MISSLRSLSICLLPAILWANVGYGENRVTGVVLDHKANPISDAVIHLVAKKKSPRQTEFETNDRGEFGFLVGTEFPITLIATAPAQSPKAIVIDTPEQTHNLRLRLLPGRRVRFLIVNQNNESIPNVIVRATQWQQTPEISILHGMGIETRSDSSGKCVIQSAPSGEVTYEFAHPQYETTEKRLRPSVGRQTVSLRKKSFTDIIAKLDRESEALPQRFEQVLLGTQWQSSKQLTFRSAPKASSSSTPQGLRVGITQDDTWQQSGLSCDLVLTGDFDVQSDYAIDEFEGSGGSAILEVTFSDLVQKNSRAVRRVGPSGNVVSSQRQWRTHDGIQNKFLGKRDSGQAGTLRVARRGKHIRILSRPNETAEFQIIDEYPWTDSATQKTCVRLIVAAPVGGTIQATWKSLRIRANQILDASINNPAPRRIFRMTADGKNTIQITDDAMGASDHLSPTLSPDGKLLAFELFNGDPKQSHVIQVAMQDRQKSDIGLGCIPNFTSDGKHIAYSSFSGMKLHSIDDNATTRVSIGGSWTLKASPIDSRLACIQNYNQTGANLLISSHTKRRGVEILQGDNASRYSQLPFYFAWSPRGDRIAFIGRRASGQGRDLCVVSTDGSSKGFEVLCDASQIHNDIDWHPDGTKLVVAKIDPERGFNQIYLVPIDNPSQMIRLNGQPDDADNRGPEYSPDGKQLYFSSQSVLLQ